MNNCIIDSKLLEVEVETTVLNDILFLKMIITLEKTMKKTG